MRALGGLWLDGSFGLATLTWAAVSTAQAPPTPPEVTGFVADVDDEGCLLSRTLACEQYSYDLCTVEQAGDWFAGQCTSFSYPTTLSGVKV